MEPSENTRNSSKEHLFVLIIVFAVVTVLSFFTGYRIGKRTASKQISESETFYAVITDIQDRSFTVKGLEVNDINYRGEFTFSVTDTTALSWRGTEINLTDLEPGDTISITYSGYSLSIYPAVLQDVSRIQLLDDEL